MQPEERKKLLSLKETPSLKDNRDSPKERSRSTTPSVLIVESVNGDGGSDNGQTEREESPTGTSDPVLPSLDEVDGGTIRGNESASSFRVLASSGDASEGGEGGGGVVGDGLTEEERETVSHARAVPVPVDDLPIFI